MADSTLRGAFELSAEQPIRQLHSIRDAGMEADASLERLGTRMDSLPRRAATGWGGMARVVDREAGKISTRIDELDAKLDAFGRKSPTANVSLSGVDRANIQLTELEARLDRLDRRRASAHVGIGGGFSNAAGGGGGGGPGRLFSSLGGIGGALPWWAGLLPAAPGLIGGATSLVGSAGSAALGAGVLGLGGVGALGAGGIASAIVGKSAVKDLQEVTKAQQAYTAAVQEYGRASAQARTEKLKLDQALVSAPPGAAGAARQTSLLSSAFKTATRPAYSSVYSAIGQGAYSIRQALPQLSPLINSATGTTARSGAQFTRFLTDPTSIRSYQTLVAGFVQDLPLIEQSGEHLTRTFLNLAGAAQPFFHDALRWVDSWTAGLARSSGDTAKVQNDMRGMVNSAKDWGRLLGAAEHLLRDIFRAGTPQGNNMVSDLTTTLNTWDRWIQRNPQKVEGFFNKAEQSTSNIATILKNLTHDLWQIFQYLQPILSRAEDFLKFATSLGGGNLAVGGALAYGGYQGIRSALGGRGPSAGGALSTFVLGPSPLRGGGAGAATAAAASSEAAAAARIAQAERTASLHSFLSRGRVGTALADRAYTSGLLDRAAVGGGALASGVRGAARIALPVLGISALLSTVQRASAGGTAAQSLGAGLRTLSLNTLSPRQAAAIAPAATGAFPAALLARSALRGGAALGGGELGGLGGALAGIPLGVLGAYGGLMAFPESAGPTPQHIAGAIHAQAQGFNTQLQGTNTVAGLRRLRGQAQLALQRLPWSIAAESANPQADEAKMRAFLTRLMKAASDKAGAVAAGSWIDALTRGLERDPKKAINTALHGMLSQLERLGPAGARAFSKDMGAWAKQMELDNPKLRGPLDDLMNGIARRLNRLAGNTGQTMHDMMNKVFWFNGQMLTGTEKTWAAMSDAMVNPSKVAQEKLSGIWGEIQSQALSVLKQMGFTSGEASSIIKLLPKNLSFSQTASTAVASAAHVSGTVTRMSAGQPPTSAAGTFVGQGVITHARGGMLGGTGLLDTVPLPDGSLAAPGEAYIANRHTMQELDLASLAYYGKTAWQKIRDEPRPHSAPMQTMPGVMNFNRHAHGGRYTTGGGVGPPSSSIAGGATRARTGYVYPFPGFSPGRTDQGYDLSGAGPIYAIGSGTVTESGLWPGWPGTGGVVYRLDAGPEAGRNVYYMEHVQSNVSVGQHVSAGQAIATLLSGYPNLEAGWADAASQGPLTRYNGAADGTPMPGGINFRAFVNALLSGGKLPAGIAGGATGGVAPVPQIHLKAPRSGLSGVPGVMADHISQAWAAGLSRHVNENLQKRGAMGTAGSTAGLSGTEMQIVRQLAQRYGWTSQIGDWSYVLNRESNGSLTDTNPSSGAYGLAQFINGPSEYYTYGGNPNTYAGQLLAMANYIKGRYGDPAGAAAHERANNWYERGGRVAWGGWNDKGGDFLTNGPTVFGAGERRREHVSITPVQSGGVARRITLNFTGPVHFGGTKKELDETARYVAGKILDALDGGQDATDHDLIGAPR